MDAYTCLRCCMMCSLLGKLLYKEARDEFGLKVPIASEENPKQAMQVLDAIGSRLSMRVEVSSS